MIALLIVFPLVMLLAAVISHLAGSGHIPRNGFVGLRIPSTMYSDEAWRAGHHAAVRPAWIGFAVATVVSAIALLSGGSATDLMGPIVVGATLLVTVVWLVVAAGRAAQSAFVEPSDSATHGAH